MSAFDEQRGGGSLGVCVAILALGWLVAIVSALGYARLREEPSLDLALMRQNPESLKRLLLHSDVKQLINDLLPVHGEYPLCVAVANRDLQSVLLLLKHGASPDARFTNSELCFHSALQDAGLAFARVFLEHGVNLSLRSSTGRSILMIQGAFQLLGAQRIAELPRTLINALDGNGRSALFLAVERRDEQLAVALLGAGADPNIADKLGQTPLIMAVRWGALKISQALLDAGANVNHQDSRGTTALMAAIVQGHKTARTAVQLLIEHGADASLRDISGKTALQCAGSLSAQDFAAVKMLLAPANAPATVSAYEQR